MLLLIMTMCASLNLACVEVAVESGVMMTVTNKAALRLFACYRKH